MLEVDRKTTIVDLKITGYPFPPSTLEGDNPTLGLQIGTERVKPIGFVADSTGSVTEHVLFRVPSGSYVTPVCYDLSASLVVGRVGYGGESATSTTLTYPPAEICAVGDLVVINASYSY